MNRINLFLLSLVLILVIPLNAEQASVDKPRPDQPIIDEGGRVENPPETLDLAYKFKEGEINRYQVQMMNSGSFRLLNQKDEVPLTTVTEMFFRQTVKGEEDKLFKVEWTLLSGTVRIRDFGQSVITLPEMTYTMDERGTVKKISGLDKLAVLPGKPQQKTIATLLAQLRFQGFPTKPLKTGDEWTREYTMDLPESDKITFKATSKLAGYEKCDGYDCAKIETKYEYPVKLEIEDKTNGNLKLEGKESGTIMTRFAYKEGRMIRSEGDIKADASARKADGSSGDAFLKLESNVVSRLLPPSKAGKEGEKE